MYVNEDRLIEVLSNIQEKYELDDEEIFALSVVIAHLEDLKEQENDK